MLGQTCWYFGKFNTPKFHSEITRPLKEVLRKVGDTYCPSHIFGFLSGAICYSVVDIILLNLLTI